MKTALEYFTVIADAELWETEIEQYLFCCVDSAQFVFGYLFTIRDTCCEARKRRLVPGGQTELSGQRADLVFGQFSLTQGAFDSKFFDRAQSGPIIAQVIHI